MDGKISKFAVPKKAEADWCIPILAYVLDHEVDFPDVYIPRQTLEGYAKRPVAMEVKENGDIRVFLLKEDK